MSGTDGEMSKEAKQAVISISKEILDLYVKNENLTDEDFQIIARLYIEKIFYQNLLSSETEETK